MSHSLFYVTVLKSSCFSNVKQFAYMLGTSQNCCETERTVIFLQLCG